MILAGAIVTTSAGNKQSLFTISRGVSSTEFGDLETLCKAVVKEKQPFERLEVSKETLLKMFKVRGTVNTPICRQHIFRLCCSMSYGNVFDVLKLFKTGNTVCEGHTCACVQRSCPVQHNKTNVFLSFSTTNSSVAFWMRRSPPPLPRSTGLLLIRKN